MSNYFNEQTTAYIKVINGKHMTEVRSHGKLVKVVKTVKSQIRKPRESCLYNPEPDKMSDDRYHNALRRIMGEEI